MIDRLPLTTFIVIMKNDWPFTIYYFYSHYEKWL